MRALRLLEALLAAALVGVALRQRASGQGFESGFLAVALLVAPAHAARLLVSQEDRRGGLLVLAALEAAALAGALAAYPVPAWATALALAVAAALAWRGEDDPAVPSLAGALAAPAALLAAGAATGLEVARAADSTAWVRAGALALVLLEAVVSWRERSRAAALRRVATAALLLGTSRLLSGVWVVTAAPRLAAALVVAPPALLHLVTARVPLAERPRARRRAAMRVLAPVFVLSLLGGLAELALHLVPNKYRETVWASGSWHKPGGSYTYEGMHLSRRQPFTNVVTWNARGWHDADHELAKPRGTTRLVVLGDSYVEGVQVPVDDLYHRRVERALTTSDRPVEAVGLGWSGWGQGQELECLEKDGLAYGPDLVLVEFLPMNDVRNNDDELEELANRESVAGTRARELFVLSIEKGLLLPALVFDQVDLVQRRAEGRRDPVDSDVLREKPKRHAELWARAWRRTEELLARTRDLLAGRGVPLVVVIFTSPLDIETCARPTEPAPDGLDPRLPARRMTELCARLGVPCLDLAPRFAKHPEAVRAGLHLVNDGHWSKAGHAEAAAETARFLREETDLLRRALEHAAR